MSGSTQIDKKKVEGAGKIVATAAHQYVDGKISLAKFNDILAKAQKIPGFMDFYNIEILKEERAEKYRSGLDNAQLLKFDGNWWRALKKEAGIRSGKLFQSDAKVGKHIDEFNAGVVAWKKSGGGSGRLGDPGKLQKAIKSGENLKRAFAEFIRKKEFTSDLAQQLRAKILKFDQDLDKILKYERDTLQVYTDYVTKKKNELEQTLKKSGLPY